MTAWIRRWSIATRLFALQFAVVAALTGASFAWLFADTRATLYDEAARVSMTVASSVSANPFVHAALGAPDPSAQLEPYALATMRATSTDFITIMRPDRTRYTHPNPAEIGRPFVGTIAPALQGRSFSETYTGTLGPSVRAVVPIRNSAGRIIALVAAGVEVRNIDSVLWPRMAVVLLAAAATLLLGGIVAWLFSRYLRRVTWGRGPDEMGRMFAYYEGVLHSVREGLVLIDQDRRTVLCNDHAAELLSLPPQPSALTPRRLADLDLPADLSDLFASGRQVSDAVFVAGERVLVVNQEITHAPRRDGAGPVLGTVASLRDHTELRRLAGELHTLRTLSDALRSQSHEFANRLHTIAALIELGHPRDALQFVTNRLDAGQQLADELAGSVEEPVLAALLLGKSSQALERGVQLTVDIDADLGELDIPADAIVTILGNLIDNAIDAASGRPNGAGTVSVTVRRDPSTGVWLRVADDGPGLSEPERAFERGYSTKGTDGRGLGLPLVRQCVQRLGGEVHAGNEGGAVFAVHLPPAVLVEQA